MEDLRHHRREIPGLEPDDIRFPAEPRQLAFCESAGGAEGLVDRLLEAQLPLQMLGKLTISDRLKRQNNGIQTGNHEILDFFQPPGGKHPERSTRDPIVQDGPRKRQTDPQRRQRLPLLGGCRVPAMPPGERSPGAQGDLEGAQRALAIAGLHPPMGYRVEHAKHSPQGRQPASLEAAAQPVAHLRARRRNLGDSQQ
jgi:hypothetical protein